MPTVLCHACAKPTTLPDGWGKPGYDCPHCGAVVLVTASESHPVPSVQPAHPAVQPATARVLHTHTHDHTVGSGFRQSLGQSLGRTAGTLLWGVGLLVAGVLVILIVAAAGK